MKTLFIGCALLFFAAMSWAEAPAKEVTCRACHGPAGAKPMTAIYPKLDGQNQAYLESAIKAYQKGERKGGMAAVMAAQVASLTEEEIKALAAYYAAQ